VYFPQTTKHLDKLYQKENKVDTSNSITISKKDFDDIRVILEWVLSKQRFFNCDCEPHHESDTNATIHADGCSSFMDDHVEITLDNLNKAAKMCGHKFVHGGVKYEIQDWKLPGSGARAVYYYDWFYCERCLENKYTQLPSETSTYDKILFGATPRAPR
jgi:hypothetical protein